LFDLLKRVRIDGGGDADLLTAFLDPDDLPLTLQANGAFRIDVFQDQSELYGLPGSEGSVRFKEYPRAAEISCDTFAGFKFYRQFASVARLPAPFRFFQDLSSDVWFKDSVMISGTPYAKGYIFLYLWITPVPLKFVEQHVIC